MVTITTNNWEHRVLNNGLVESRWIRNNDPKDENTHWAMRSPGTLGMTGGEYSIVREHLLALSNVFPVEYVPIPVVSESVGQIFTEPMAPR